MTPIAAVMATRFEPPQLRPLLELLRRDHVTPVVMSDSGPHAPDWSLYALWNAGVRYAVERGALYVCVMNDDIGILPGTLGRLAHWLDARPEVGVVYPDTRRWTGQGYADTERMEPTAGTWGAGGLTGFCFMFRADLGIAFDEGYRLWYGDDAFEEAVRERGLLVARIAGIPIDHVPGQSTAQLPPDEVAAMIAADRARWSWSLRRREAVPA